MLTKMEYEHFIVVYRIILNYLFIFISISNVINSLFPERKMRAAFAEYCQPHVLFNILTAFLWESKIQKFKYTQYFATCDKKKWIKPMNVYKQL